MQNEGEREVRVFSAAQLAPHDGLPWLGPWVAPPSLAAPPPRPESIVRGELGR